MASKCHIKNLKTNQNNHMTDQYFHDGKIQVQQSKCHIKKEKIETGLEEIEGPIEEVSSMCSSLLIFMFIICSVSSSNCDCASSTSKNLMKH